MLGCMDARLDVHKILVLREGSPRDPQHWRGGHDDAVKRQIEADTGPRPVRSSRGNQVCALIYDVRTRRLSEVAAA